MMTRRFYIIGCQRSGTTLLRLILESHSSVVCRDEPRCYEMLSNDQKLEGVMKEATGKKWIGFKIPRFTEQLNNLTIYDYGVPNIPGPFRNFYNNEPLIFIVRDVRDVICSMRELRADNKPWIERWGIPIVKYWIENSDEFRKQFDSDILRAKISPLYEMAMSALFWKFKNVSYFKYLKLKFPILLIKYEDLITYPREIISKINKFLDLDWEDSLLQHNLLPHTEIDKDGFAIGGTNARYPIGSFHLGRYRNELNEDQLDEINSISGDVMRSFGYST